MHRKLKASPSLRAIMLATTGLMTFGAPVEAANVIFLKRSMRPGFAGIDNDLLFDERTTLLFGDAKDTLAKLVKAVEEA